MIRVFDPAAELELWSGTAWGPMPANYSGTTIRWRPKANGTKFYFLIENVTLLSWKFFNNNATSANGTTINISRACIEQDTDGDNIPNHLDLDSDGDLCADAIEAGSSVIATSTTVYPTGTDTNTNGLLPNYESTLEGFINYYSTYDPNALSTNVAFCRDFDGDGLLDINDIDDDNDGTLDVVESPSCFYTKAALLSGARPDIEISTSLAMSATVKFPEKLVDGASAATGAVNFTATTTAAQAVYTFTMPVAMELKTIYVGYTNTSTHFNAGTVLRLEGSNNNTTWTTLGNGYAAVTAVPGVTGTVNANTFTVTQNSGRYKLYRIYWVSGGGINALGFASEVYFETSPTYDASSAPKAICDSDTDNDGKYNYLDNDSDGDGCSDALESEATTITTANYAFPAASVGLNGLSDGLETVADNGTINYTSKYINAISNNIAYCVDTDHDGITNTDDIDDDNDGILDAVESPTCFTQVEIGYKALDHKFWFLRN